MLQVATSGLPALSRNHKTRKGKNMRIAKEMKDVDLGSFLKQFDCVEIWVNPEDPNEIVGVSGEKNGFVYESPFKLKVIVPGKRKGKRGAK